MIIIYRGDDFKASAENLNEKYPGSLMLSEEKLNTEETIKKIQAYIIQFIKKELENASKEDRAPHPCIISFLGHSERMALGEIHFLDKDSSAFATEILSLLPEKYKKYPIKLDLLGCETGFSVLEEKTMHKKTYASYVSDILHEKGFSHTEVRAFSNLLNTKTKNAKGMRLLYRFNKGQLFFDVTAIDSLAHSNIIQFISKSKTAAQLELQTIIDECNEIVEKEESTLSSFLKDVEEILSERINLIEKERSQYMRLLQVFEKPIDAWGSNIAHKFTPDLDKTKENLMRVKKDAEKKLSEQGLYPIQIKLKHPTSAEVKLTPPPDNKKFDNLVKNMMQLQGLAEHFTENEEEAIYIAHIQYLIKLFEMITNRYKKDGEAKRIEDALKNLDKTIEEFKSKGKNLDNILMGKNAYQIQYNLINQNSNQLILLIDNNIKLLEKRLLSNHFRQEMAKDIATLQKLESEPQKQAIISLAKKIVAWDHPGLEAKITKKSELLDKMVSIIQAKLDTSVKFNRLEGQQAFVNQLVEAFQSKDKAVGHKIKSKIF